MYPILFEIPKVAGFGPFKVHSFGVMMVLAFAAALWVARKRAPKFGVDQNKITDAGFWGLVFGVLGARVVFILQDLPYYSKHLNEVFTLQFQGLTSFGGLIFAVVALGVWARREGIPVQRMFDICAPAYSIGYILGRVGCLLNGCCYGGICPPDFILATTFGRPEPHHPAQIYDAAMNLLALGGLFLLERRNLRIGQAAAYYLAAHGLARFVYEFWRAGSPMEVEAGLASSTRIGNTPFTEAQIMALVLVVFGIVWYLVARKNRPEFERIEPSPVARATLLEGPA
jgi:phosphatidylglycerol---prolipoprotein diacylglyceryl transferase